MTQLGCYGQPEVGVIFIDKEMSTELIKNFERRLGLTSSSERNWTRNFELK